MSDKAYDDPTVRDAIDSLRFLSIDAIQKANSGHPGAPLGLAPLMYRLYTEHMSHDPADPDWPNRDRFVLSAGHASAVLYATLHMAGYDVSMDDLKSFRQWGSITPGHPEYRDTPGVETTTGPLGQGFGNAVGMALSVAMAAARFNEESLAVFDHHVFCVCGDGDMMEGITAEAASLAGFLGLDKLIVFYDDNSISLSGPTSLAFGEDVAGRFEAYGWKTIRIEDVNDLEAIDAAVTEAKNQTDRPTLVLTRTHIGFGSPFQDTSKAHGAPLGPDAVAATRERLDWNYPPFEIPTDATRHWATLVGRQARAKQAWESLVETYSGQYPQKAAELARFNQMRLPDGWASEIDAIGAESLPDDSPLNFETGSKIATRVAGGRVVNHLAQQIPELVGGSADLNPSTKTAIAGADDIRAGHYGGRNIQFGVREHAMGAMANGFAVHTGFRIYCATFFAFSEYMVYPMRMAAMMKVQTVFVYTHDSIGLGEDGPTHQPVEQLALLRAIPGLHVIRPADANETAQAWKTALEFEGPTALVLSRQGLPVLDPANLDVSKGATVIADGDDAVIIGTGSEVELALAARTQLAGNGIRARVVSMPCWEIFDAQDADYRESVLPDGVPTVAVEAAVELGWYKYADAFIGMHSFGASAPAPICYDKFGITADAVAAKIAELIG